MMFLATDGITVGTDWVIDSSALTKKIQMKRRECNICGKNRFNTKDLILYIGQVSQLGRK